MSVFAASHVLPSLAMLASVALLMAAAGCSSPVQIEEETAADPPASMQEVENFAVYFGGGEVDALSTYDLAIIDADAQDGDTARRLLRQGTLPLAYLNIGEAEGYRWFFDRVETDWIIEANANWDDHFFVDAREPGWQRLLLETVIPAIRDKGYSGLFLDMADVGAPGYYPETRPGVVRLIRRVHQRYPEMTLVMNNGLVVIDDVGGVLDGLTVESAFTRYGGGTYRRTRPEARDYRVRQLRQVRRTHDLPVLAIDYAAPDDDALRAYARRRAHANGFLSFVAPVALDSVSARQRSPEDAPPSSSGAR